MKCLKQFNFGTVEGIDTIIISVTARQYGEVRFYRDKLLPDASTGQSPGTLARKLSRRAPRERSEQRGCKEGMAQFLPSWYKFY